MNRAVALFAGACVLALVVGHLLRDTPGYMVHNPDGTITGDITHYVYWTRLVALGGAAMNGYEAIVLVHLSSTLFTAICKSIILFQFSYISMPLLTKRD